MSRTINTAKKKRVGRPRNLPLADSTPPPKLRRNYDVGHTICRYCGSRAFVAGTLREVMPDGRILITRQMKCVGKHHHRYPLKSVIAG